PTPSDFVTRISEAFAPGGLLSKARNFEPRPQQQKMAEEVADALANEHHLLVEAGTGVGKSLAYLLPALLHAKEQNKKAIVSTYTINLQQQLLNKDIALLERLLPFDFQATLLKGRQNYICPRRLRHALKQANDLFPSPEQAELHRLAAWLQRTQDGTLSDLDPLPNNHVWSHVCSEAHVCTPKTCGHDDQCFYQKARQRQEEADLVILNHDLLLTLLNPSNSDQIVSSKNYLFANDFLIIDEAHCLETVASRHIGLSFTSGQIRFLLQRLYHPKTKKGLIRQLHQPQLEKAVLHLTEEVEQFFLRVEAACNFAQSNDCRVTRPDWVEDTLSLPMMELRQLLIDHSKEVEDDLLHAEMREAARRLLNQRNDLAHLVAQKFDDHVYWVSRSAKHPSNFELNAAPINLAGPLRTLLFGSGRSAILTSATLSSGNDLSYIQNRIGADEAKPLQLDSPFDLARQMKVLIPRNIPAPDSPEHEAALYSWIRYFLNQTHGKALILFTRKDTLIKTAQVLAPWARDRDITLLAQDGVTSRESLLQTFKDDLNSVLLGTDSFWQGVDVPGPSLSSVIITRLPFPHPDNPVVQAKCEALEAEGRSPFTHYSLPEAILKFRQGVGRLIRTKTDTGYIIILDPRIRTKRYGSSFLHHLSPAPISWVDGEIGPDGEIIPSP
ncbi:MAG: helicase C-terminal domain-containing protein, partial [Verrucomicrobiia bacterium]